MPKLSLSIGAIILALAGSLSGQSAAAPSFRFLRTDWFRGGPKDPHVLAELKKYTVQPRPEQKREVLQSMLDGDFKPKFFLAAAKHLSGAMDKAMRVAYNAKIRPTLDDDEFKLFGVDENEDKDFFSDESNEDPAASQYAFRCLDFDGDKRIDLLIFNQAYFGPSLGLVFYGWDGKAYTYLFDCSGAIAGIERLGNKLYIRYLVTIIDPAETEILASIAYDFKTKTCMLDSKLYYAQKTRFPKVLGRPEPFSLNAPTVLRVDPKIDNKPNQKDANGYFNFETTLTLYGNAVAEYPISAGGYVLAAENNWAFVAFDTTIGPTDNSLHHGMEPGTYDKETAAFTPIIMPCQYFCGWIETKFLAKGN
jgi:hypothetical protein